MPLAAYRQKTHIGNEFCPYGRPLGNNPSASRLLIERRWSLGCIVALPEK